MEPISEERQRKVYEWLYPELKGRWWETSFGIGGWKAHHVDGTMSIQPLYSIDGQPNYQFFFMGIAPRLTVAKVRVSYNLMGCPEWYLDPETDPHMVYIHADPIAATAEYIEALEGR